MPIFSAFKKKSPHSRFFFIGSLLYDSTPPAYKRGGVRYLNILNILNILGSGEGLKSLYLQGF